MSIEKLIKNGVQTTMKIYSTISTFDQSLYSYQQEAKVSIFATWDKYDNVMFQMPTGTGKTRLFTSLIKDIIKNDKDKGKIIIIAHRKELIDQISASLSNYEIDHALFISGVKRNFSKRVQVASIASLTHPKTWKKQEIKDLSVDYIIIDEAHHTMAKTYARLCKRYESAKKLGVTATPWRMSHSGFMFFDCFKRKQEYFQTLIRSKPISWFIKEHYLSPYTYYSIQDKSDTKKLIDSIRIDDKLGDYVESDLIKKFNTIVIRAKLLDSYQKYANGKKGIVYAINQTHGKDICNQYQEAGLKAAYIDSNTKPLERKTIIERFRKGLLEVLVNVNIFSEGFDCPDVEFIQLARPTKSLALYLQQVGRGLRKTKDKSQCIILDNVGLYSTFGLPDANRQWQHHFEGSPVEISERPTSENKGLGVPVHINIAEGNEAMVMIQHGNVATPPLPTPTPTPVPAPKPEPAPVQKKFLEIQILEHIYENPGAKASDMARSILGKAGAGNKRKINQCITYKMQELLIRDGDRGGYYLSMEGQKLLPKASHLAVVSFKLPVTGPIYDQALKSMILEYIYANPGVKATDIAQAFWRNVEMKKKINSCLYHNMEGLWERDGARGGYYLSVEGQKLF